jgi:hypothetical protein
MSCELCSSAIQAEFSAEIMISFSGLKCIHDPGVSVFPEGGGLLGLRLFAVQPTKDRVAAAIKGSERTI